MKCKFIIIATLFIFVFSQLSSQIIQDSTANKTSKFKYELGLGFGQTTGNGLSFKFSISRFGIQTNLQPGLLGNRKNIFGLTFIYTFIEDKQTCLYLYQGNSINSYRLFDYMSINNGLGIGFEFNCYKNYTINIMSAFASKNSFSEFGLTLEIGIYNRF